MKKGDRFSCKIEGISAEGVVQRDGDEFFLCQNERAGKECRDKLGFEFSWVVHTGSERDLAANRVTVFKTLPDFQVGDEVEFLREENMLWHSGRWVSTGLYDIGDRATIKAVREGQVKLSNNEWYNPDGLKLVCRGELKLNETQTKEKGMKAIVSKVFKKESLETAEIIDKYMYEEDLGKGFMAELVLSKKENKDAVIAEARKRQADEISAVKSVK